MKYSFAGRRLTMATLFGDTPTTLSDKERGAAQVLLGPDIVDEDNFLFGDAGVAITEFARGGDDTLLGGDYSGDLELRNHLYGDAQDMFGFARGGDDTLIGGTYTGNGTLFQNIFL